MPWRCPHCGAGLAAASLEGASACPWCASVVYAEEGTGIPHRIVSSPRSEAEIRRAALDAFRRRGNASAPGTVTTFYVPYYVLEGAGSSSRWTGVAAASLPSSELLTIPIYGTDTRWFDPAALPAGARILEATRGLDTADDLGRVVELRHVPIAHVTYEDAGEAGSLWIDADKGRVLAGGPRPASAASLSHSLVLSLWGAAGASAASGLLLPPPWSIIGAAGAVLAFAVAQSRRLGARPGAPRR